VSEQLFNAGDRVHIAESERNGHTFGEAFGRVDRDYGGEWVKVCVDGEQYPYPHDVPAIPRELLTLVEAAEDDDEEGETAPQPRRVESSSQDLTSETAWDGTNYPTHMVEVWIMNDGKFIDIARNFARFDETGKQLGEYLGRVLFDRRALPAEERRWITRDTAHTLDLVAGDLTQDGDDTPAREALKRVDWKRIASSLTDGQ
jgi:hypothetical protein